ncbi:MAG TPA: ABC transporter substrate-binding protein [Bordetella sp.]
MAPRFAFAQEGGKSVLKFVPQANLTILDPVVTTAAVTVTHGYCVFDTLYGVNGKLEPKPQMAESAQVSADGLTWTIKLRDGLAFHDGQPVRSRDCAASLKRWGQRDTSGQELAKAVADYDTSDDRSLVIKLKKPFPRMLFVLSKPHSSPAFMMPERLAGLSASEPLTEMVGSGPFRFVAAEYVPGSKAVYEKFEGYKPRSEPADWTSGGKVVHFDRLEWHIIPDSATAASALQNGEVDWWEVPLPDLLPVLRSNANIRTRVSDPYGMIVVMRFNSAQAPFNNPKVRRAVYEAVNQSDYMNSLGLDEQDYKECLSNYPCGMPGVKNALLGKPGGLDKARQLLKESGYAGEKVVIINPTDNIMIGPLGHVTADLLKQMGFNVDLQDMDWGSVTQRRTSRESVDKGGWSIFHTTWPSVSVGDPSLNSNVRGQGKDGWFGWFDDPEIEKLASQWMDAQDPAEQDHLFEESQRRALEMMPVVMLGEFTIQTALRKNLTGDLPGSACFFWGIRSA